MIDVQFHHATARLAAFFAGDTRSAITSAERAADVIAGLGR
ncbi:hypothetical protein P0W64_06525 [Tsukamurella sp. 8F]|nr:MULTISPECIES: hypothetical protein [unclassified Tsukamurella]MDF0530108.1 hypothetical protein [Tsukamurella sp. 8J]MDF0586426.1 hypothetical protein [Tsukamurella sp. 8F]